MATLRVTISEEALAALKERAARRGLTLDEVVAERLDPIAAEKRENALGILDRIQGMNELEDEVAGEIASDEVRAYRESLKQERGPR